jgi:putative ABC transport system permease protein
MTILENIRLALNGLTVNKMRTFLTMLGIIIGVAAVIALLSVGRAVEAFVEDEFQGLGNNLLFVTSGQIGPNRGPRRPGGSGLTNDDVQALSDPLRAPDLIGVAAEYGRAAVVTRGRNETRTSITGVTPNFPEIRNFYPQSGLFFDEADNVRSARVAVLGYTAYEALFPDGEPPEGATININGVNFQVIGLMEQKGGSGFNNQDDVIFVPLYTAQRRLFPARRADGKFRVSLIYAQIANEERQEAAIAQIQFTLRETHNITFRDDDDFTVLSQAELTDAFGEVTSMLTLFLSVIAGISLLVGGIGIMNIMLVSVTERTREIGLRKAVGAKYRDILGQFLIEAVVLALMGGLFGLLLGASGALLIANLSESLRPSLSWESVALAVSFSAAVGLFFGIYPATRAARLNPIDALRYE